MKKLVLALVLGAGVFLSPIAAKADRFTFTFAQSRPMHYPYAVVYYPVRPQQPIIYWNGHYNRHHNRHHQPVKFEQKKKQYHDGRRGHHGHSRRDR